MMDCHKGLAIAKFVLGQSFAKSSHYRARLQSSWKQVQDPQDNHVIRRTNLMPRILLGLMLPALFLLADSAWAQSNPLTLFRNYFVTGDYVVGGWVKNGSLDGPLEKGTITIPDPLQPTAAVPPGADIVAAFLYWETVESSHSQSPGKNGSFNGYAITGTFLPNPTSQSPTSWSSGGCSGNSDGTKIIQGYRADVRPFLPVDANGKVQGNGTFQVELADSGSNGNTVPFTLGATLVIVYRVQSPLVPLNSVVLYDGIFAPSNATANMSEMSQQIIGFYQAAASPVAKLTHIVGGGQSNKSEQVFFNGNPLTPAGTAAFSGVYNGSWDNPTYSVNAAVLANEPSPSEMTSVVPGTTGGKCVDWGAVVFSSTVQDTDGDGLLDVWEDNQGYTDAISGQFVALPGANKLVKDIFVEIDYLSNLDGSAGPYLHSHLPQQLALDLVGDAAAAQNVRVHFDVGPTNYAGNCSRTHPAVCPDPYIIQGGTGGNSISEGATIGNVPVFVCADGATLCTFPGPAPGQPGPATVGWKGGYLFVKDTAPNPNSTPPIPLLGNFQPGRKDSYHYVLSAHALGTPRSYWTAFATTLQRTLFANLTSIVVSTVNSVTTTTVTIQTPPPPAAQGGILKPGDCPNAAIPACSDANVDRVTVTGAIVQPALSGTYHFANLTSSTDNTGVITTMFNITTAGVPDGTYTLSTEPKLEVVYGGPLSTSGRSDGGGGDTAMTFGLWLADNALGCQADPSVTLAPGQTYCINEVGTATEQGGTLLHELGHTLFLAHGGTFFPNEAGVVTSGPSAGQYLNSPPVVPSYGLNCDPGFLSSMNYLFQVRGFPDNGGIDYSGQTLPDLLETMLNEQNGIGSDRFTGQLAAHFTRWYAPPNALDTMLQNTPTPGAGGRFATHHCDGSPILDGAQMVRLDGSTFSAPIDWNNDNTIESGTISPQDINFNDNSFNSPSGSNVDSPFVGFNDWINIDLRQVSSRANTFAFSGGGIAQGIPGIAQGIPGIAQGFPGIAEGVPGIAQGIPGIAQGFPGITGGAFGAEQDEDAACSTADRPTGLSAVQTASKTVVLTWTPPAAPCLVNEYNIWRAVGSFPTLQSVIANHALFKNIGNTMRTVNPAPPPTTFAPATTFTDTNVKNTQTYTYFVTDTNKQQGAQSGASIPATITVQP